MVLCAMIRDGIETIFANFFLVHHAFDGWRGLSVREGGGGVSIELYETWLGRCFEREQREVAASKRGVIQSFEIDF